MQPLAQNGYTEQEVLDALLRRHGSSTMTFRYEHLDQANRVLGDLDNVLSGTVTQDYLADIKRTARFRLRDDGQINYLSDRIKPWARITLPRTDRTLGDELGEVPSTLLRWSFDERTGAPAAADSSGHNRSGAVGGGVTTGRPALVTTGSAYSFSTAGNATVAASGAASYLAGLRRLTVVSWIKADSTGHSRGWISGKTPAASGDSSFGTRFAAVGPLSGAANCIRVWVTVDGLLVSVETAAHTATTDTTSVIWSWQSGIGIRVWLNGQPADLVEENGPAVGGLSDVGTLTIGRCSNTSPASSGGWGGSIDEVSLYAGTIDDATAMRIYRAGAGTGPYGSANFAEWPQGVYLPTSPTRDADANGVVVRDVQAYDQLLVLRDDKVDNRTAAASGTRYTDQVRTFLTGAGITNVNITPSSTVIPVTKEWEPGTTKLAIVNDLLAAINYESLYFDEDGVAIARPYVSPQDRPPEFTYAADERSVIAQPLRQTLDLFAVPNKWTLVVSDPDRPVLTSTASNNDPASPTSTVSRGRTIVDFRTEQDAADQAALDAKVARLAFEASQVFEEINFPTALMPIHSHNDVYALVYPDLGVSERYSERAWELPLQAGATMAHTIRRVVTV